MIFYYNQTLNRLGLVGILIAAKNKINIYICLSNILTKKKINDFFKFIRYERINKKQYREVLWYNR